MRLLFSPLALALALALATTSPALARPGASVVEEARAFMAAYAADLAAGDRAAVAARYDREGAYFLVGGDREFSPYEAIVRDYAESWRPPTAFAWEDLRFDPAGADAVVVNGRFVWTTPQGAQTFTYTGFLRRQDGRLRIRLENETPARPHRP